MYNRPFAIVVTLLLLFAPLFCVASEGDKEQATRTITVTDPGIDCEFHLLPNKIRIAVPATNNDLSSVRGMSAPRLLRKVAGDFVVQVKVTADFNPGTTSTGPGPPYNGAGILIWENENNFFRLERSAARSNETLLCYPPLIEYWRNGAYQGFNNAVTKVEDYFQGRSTWLKVARQGPKLAISISHDGKKWEDVKSVPVEFPEELFVGVAALNTSSTPFSVDFEELTIVDSKDARDPLLYPSKVQLERVWPAKSVVNDADTAERSAAAQYKVFDLVHQDAASIVKIVSHVVPASERKTLRVAAHAPTNSVVASGRAQDLAVLEKLVSHLDQPDQSAAGSQD